ncbi:hypothetical protein GGI12_003865 [Dipsacomyces acuminosporus]|nr:hypothetical protein GGI12_003865 [Dipsacomyces acuminosporus]
MTIVISVVNKDFSLNPMNIACELVWGFVPMYAIACAFLAIICPVLLFITWGLKEAYGIRKDLIICVTSGIVGSILMIIWEFKFPQFDDIWSDLFFVWDYAFLIHIFSVVVPLWHATRHMRKLDHHLRSESPGSTSTVTLMKSEDAVSSEPALPTRVVRFEEKVIKHKEYGKFRQAFVHVLDDPALYAQFRDFSCACFCSELISFIDEYQTLKVLTLIALGQHEYSAEPVYRAYNTPLMQSPMSAMFVVPEDGNHSDSIADLPRNVNLSKLHNSVTVGILEAAKEIYPDRGFNHATMFPPALMDTLVMIFSTYINSSSPTAVNVPQIMIRRIQEKLNKNQLYLTILDDVKDEVLYMLYLNVFTRFSS